MLIDWFTVVAQLLNFLILVWLMKRFLYQPILKALDARERKITAELAAADGKKREAQTERDEFLRKNQEFARQRAELFRLAAEEVKVERQRLLQEARQAADNLRAKRQEALRSEQQSLTAAVSRRTQVEVFAIARKTLADLADVSLEKQMVAVFVDKLRHYDTGKQQLRAALENSDVPLLVRTAFDLPAAQMVEIEHVVQETFGIDAQLQFKTSPYLISGIELSCNGQKISWSIADYLARLEKNLNELLQPHVEIKPSAVPELESKSKIAENDADQLEAAQINFGTDLKGVKNFPDPNVIVSAKNESQNDR